MALGSEESLFIPAPPQPNENVTESFGGLPEMMLKRAEP